MKNQNKDETAITQYEYFQKRGILSQYRNLKTQSEFNAYELERRNLFTDKLFLPPSAFKGSQLLEIGPSAGENALVFAKWGANCTLVEPNLTAHPYIKEYFERFGLSQRLLKLDGSTLEEYSELSTARRFDFIAAEGFIYLVKPDEMWMDFFSRTIKDSGFVILNYCETFGNFQELLLKAIHTRVCELTGLGSLEAAEKWFGTKWNSFPHTTKLDSWVADVLENPTVRLNRFYELKAFNTGMQKAGFRLYSSWPPYKDSSIIYWVKKGLTAKEQLDSENEFISRSRLSHMFGRKLLLRQADPSLEGSLTQLLTLTDSLIDDFGKEKAAQCIKHLTEIEKVLEPDTGAVLTEPQDREDALNTVKSIKQILNLLIIGNADGIAAFCNTDKAFIRSWGMATHYAIFRKGGEQP